MDNPFKMQTPVIAALADTPATFSMPLPAFQVATKSLSLFAPIYYPGIALILK
jgi:hypothetical protein